MVGRVSLVQRAAEKNSSRLPAVPQVATYRILTHVAWIGFGEWPPTDTGSPPSAIHQASTGLQLLA